jgi:two-component system sensor histidine kinase KdpD
VRYGGSVFILVLCTVLALWLNALELAETNLVMTYVLGVTVTSAWFGAGPGIMVSICGVLLFNFFFTTPYYTLIVDDTEYIVTFSVMLAISLLISELLSRIRQQAEEAQTRQRQTRDLYEFSRRLTGSAGPKNIVRVAEERLNELFQCPAVVLTPGEHRKLTRETDRSTGENLGRDIKDMAYESFRENEPRGRGTGSEEMIDALIAPLVVTEDTLGVVVLLVGNRTLPDNQVQMIKTCATLIALALERDELAEETREMLLEVEVERMRSALLSSISHDLRTPLASIAGSAENLHKRTLSTSTRENHIETIYEESRRMLRMVDNLLSMVRIESGNLEVDKEWHMIEDVIGSALNRLDETLGDRSVDIEIPDESLLVPLDGVLIEQVLINVINNAVNYTPEGTPIEISVETAGSQLMVKVADHGSGIDPEKTDELFRKFVRADDSSDGQRTGLGLAISKAIVEAHSGSINASNRETGGAVFTFSLPVEGTPPELPESSANADLDFNNGN